jgi:polysaccharide pyruvyl transferase WcaK-like protein
MVSGPENTCRIGIFGNVGINNLGNECTLQSLIENIRLRLPHAELFIVCSNPTDTEARHRLPTVQMEATPLIQSPHGTQRGVLTRILHLLFVRLPTEVRDFFRAARQLKDVDLLLMAGTGMLTDDGEAPLGLPFQILKWSLAARLRGARVRFVAVGVGPLSTRLARWFVRSALRCADYRSYRDLQSHQRLVAAGFIHYQDRVVPDLAFSFPRSLLPKLKSSTKRTIGVGVIDHLGRPPSTSDGPDDFETYLSKMVNFVAELIDRQFSVRLLYGDSVGDYAAGKQLAARLEQRSGKYGAESLDSSPIQSVEALLAAIAETDLVVSPRFHNLVLGAMLGKPIIAISYDVKNEALADRFGFSAYCQPIWNLERSKLVSDCVHALGRDGAHAFHLARTADELRMQWELEYPAVLKLMRPKDFSRR